MKLSKRFIGGITLFGVGLALTLYFGQQYRQADKALTVAPPRKAGAPSPLQTQSYVALPIRISAEALTELSNKLVPAKFDIPRQRVFHDRAWTRNPINGNEITIWSVSVDGYGTVSRGSFSVASEGGAFDVTMPIHGWFRAQKGGSHETAEADAVVRVSAPFDVGEDWNPVVTPSVSYHWVNRPVARLFGLFDLSLGSLAHGQIDSQINKLKAQLPALLQTNLPLRSQMETVWKDAHSVIQVSQNPAAWLSIDPVAAFMQKPSSDKGDLVLNVGIIANVSLSNTRPSKPQPEPLPPLKKQPPDAIEGFSLNTPIDLDYLVLSKELASALASKPFEIATPTGKATILIKDVVVYPSAPKLAVGALIEADMPDRWLDTKGWVYISATPTFDPATRRLTLTEIEFSRAVDNKVASALTLAFRKTLVAEFTKRATIDLKVPLATAVARTNTFLNEGLDQQIRVALSKKVGQIGIDPNHVDVAGEVRNIHGVSISLMERSLVVTPTIRGNVSFAYRVAAPASAGPSPPPAPLPSASVAPAQ